MHLATITETDTEKVMPLHPGDILSPGTPGAIHVRPGDVAECRIPGVGTLRNEVVQG